MSLALARKCKCKHVNHEIQSKAFAQDYKIGRIRRSDHDSFPPAEIKTQRRIRQMCVIVLRSWTHNRAFVVVVVLIANIPIQPMVQLDSEPCFRRLKAHRIRGDQSSRISGRISYSITLTVVFVNAVSREERDTRCDTAYRLNIEEVIPDEIETVPKQVLNAIEEIIEFRVAVYPMVVVAGSNGEPRGCGPIE